MSGTCDDRNARFSFGTEMEGASTLVEARNERRGKRFFQPQKKEGKSNLKRAARQCKRFSGKSGKKSKKRRKPSHLSQKPSPFAFSLPRSLGWRIPASRRDNNPHNAAWSHVTGQARGPPRRQLVQHPRRLWRTLNPKPLFPAPLHPAHPKILNAKCLNAKPYTLNALNPLNRRPVIDHS